MSNYKKRAREIIQALWDIEMRRQDPKSTRELDVELVEKALQEAEDTARRKENERWQKIVKGFGLNHFTHGILQKGRARMEAK